MLASLFMLSLLSACEEVDLQATSQVETNEQPKDPGVYPMSISRAATRSGESSGFWESWNFITLNTGIQVPTPWNQTATYSAVPHDLLEDIKYDDGWDLIYYKLEDKKGSTHTGNSPFLVFHNRYTGILKGFCYITPESFTPSNYGIWQINTENPSSLFAFQNYPITKISEKQKKMQFVSNVTNNVTQGFCSGWNCFQLELAYDPSQSGWLYISTFSKNESEITLSGNLKSHTEGLLNIYQGNRDSKSGIAQAAGNEAGKWITRKLNDKTILGIPPSIIAEGVKSVVTGGVGSIIKAFTGLFRKDDTPKSLQLTTNGTFTINGTSTFTATTSVIPIEINLCPDSVGYLGVWGLKDEPTLLFSPYAMLKSPHTYTNGYTREYGLSITNHSYENAKVLINPTLDSYVQRSGSSTKYYQSSSYTRPNVFGTTGATGKDDNKNQSRVYDDLYTAGYDVSVNVAFKDEEGANIPIDQYEAPMEIFIPKVPNGPAGALPQFSYNSKYVASVCVSLTLPNGSTALSYHQCYPKVNWNYSEFNNGLYRYLYPCEPLVRIDSRSFSSTGNNRNLIEILQSSDNVRY